MLWPPLLLLQAAPDLATLARQADTARDAGNLAAAEGLYRQALAVDKSWREGWWSLGTIAYDQDRYSDAADAFQRLTDLDAKAGSARVMLGLCEFELGRDSDALRHILDGERIGVADNQQLRQVALYHEGMLEQRAGKFEAAERALNTLCIAGVESQGLTVTLGSVALRMQNKTSPPGDKVARIGHAQCLAAQKRYDEARREYQSIVSANENDPDVHYAFGRMLLDAHDSDAGFAELETTVKLRPADAIARLQIAAAKYKVDSAGAIPYARAAVATHPALPLGHYLLGLLLLDTGDFRAAIPELETAQHGMPETPNVYAALSSAYAQAGRDADAARARQMQYKLKVSAEAAAAHSP